jgi:hypothetical protein
VTVDHLEAVVLWRFENVDRRLIDDIADSPSVFLWLTSDQIDACEWHSIAPVLMFSSGIHVPSDGPRYGLHLPS